MATNNSSDYQSVQYNVHTGAANGALNNVAPSATSGVPLISQGSSSQPLFGTAVVAGGGTGDTSFTAYSVICGGTTTTGSLQNVSGVGTSGQVLTSNGASALPTWQAASGGSAIIQVSNQVFTSSGTYTPTSGMVYCSIQCIGGGGGGGGAITTGSGQLSVGGGGGAGEYASGIFSAASIGVSQTVTIGAAGAANSGATGGNGDTTSVGSLITAGGGSGGVSSTAGTSQVGAGGSGGTGGSGGDWRSQGAPGLWGYANSSAVFEFSGAGGSSQYGGGGKGTVGGGVGGNAGTGYGAGGSGNAQGNSGASLSGGAGTKGIVIITEYIN